MSVVYGPIRSRRLGYSLGIDIIPLKTCSFDCIFCELVRRTDFYTLKREPYIPKEIILDEIKKVLENINSPLDSITFSGSGEPTLNSELEEIIKGIKTITSIPVTVFTNSSLLFQPEVRKALSYADRVKFTLSALTPELFYRINRPVNGLTLDMVLSGIKDFCSEYKGELWMEIMIIEEINNSLTEMGKINEFIDKFPITQIHLNRPVRASTEPGLKITKEEELRDLAELFHLFKVSIV